MPRGGKREGAGRKPGSKQKDGNARSAWIALRCTEDEKRRLKELAAGSGMSLTDYILDRALRDESGKKLEEMFAETHAKLDTSLSDYMEERIREVARKL